VIAALQKLDVPYELIDIDPRFADTAAFCEKYATDARPSVRGIPGNERTRFCSGFGRYPANQFSSFVRFFSLFDL
jgi:hypothetical protein